MVRQLGILALVSVVVGLLGAALPPILTPNSVNTTYEPTGATLQFGASRTVFLSPGACTTLTWDVQGIQTITVNNEPTVGQGEQTLCYPNYDTFPLLSVTHTDGTKQRVQLDVFFLVESVFLWAGAIGCVWCGLAALLLTRRRIAGGVGALLSVLAGVGIISVYAGWVSFAPFAVLGMHWAWVIGVAL